MKLELTPQEVIYKFNLGNVQLDRNNNHMPEYDEVYKNIETALEIDKEGYNVYLMDDFSKDRLKNIMDFVEDKLKKKEKPEDICYVIHNDDKVPEILFLPGGMGKRLKELLEDVQRLYSEIVYEFYNSTCSKEKEDLVDNLQKNRTDILTRLVKSAEEEGFIMRPTQTGFSFIPVKEEGEVMNEKEYDDLDTEERDEILSKVGELKTNAQDILDELKSLELTEIEKIKKVMDEYFCSSSKDIREEIASEFSHNKKAVEFLSDVCDWIERDLKDVYSISYDDDEEQINEAIYKYEVNVIVDNTDNDHPPVVFEEDPSIINLLGTVEYENKNGVYVTDVSLIRAGSFLKANGGCLILRANSLLTNPSSYYYFKKCLLNGKINLDYNRGYLELLSLTGLRPETINFNTKIILIGDYTAYHLLYTYDEDFKKIFKMRAEYKQTVNIENETKESFMQKLFLFCKENNLTKLDEEAIKELAKFSSRKVENKNKFYMDDYDLNRVLILADSLVKKEGRECIEGKDIIKIAYSEDLVEKEINESYKEKKIFIDVKQKLVGFVNGLSVIDTGYFSFGKPIRITCCCYKGTGDIIDVQKESSLSGKIHNKAINILIGYMNNLLDSYEKLPIDFHLSFEQMYGQIDGDSASVAEVISMISAITKIGVKQNIAVTGSINQFGDVQPIGGVNEKIEGFFKVCKLVDSIEGKGVLIPYSNKDNLVLNKEIEEEIEKGNFHIYTMDSVQDAIEILMGEEKIGYKEIIKKVEEEVKKYSGKTRKKPVKKTAKNLAKDLAKDLDKDLEV